MQWLSRHNSASGPQRSRRYRYRWLPFVIGCALGAVTISLLWRGRDLPNFTLKYSTIVSTAPTQSYVSPSDSVPWQSDGARQDADYWFDEFKDTLATMQSPTFWNGTTWPATIQWVGAVLNTLVIASDRSLTNALKLYKSESRSGAHTPQASNQNRIRKNFADVKAYYDAEDVNQIFDAAYDDAQWVVLEWLEAIRFINQHDDYANSSLGQTEIARFAHRAHIFYNIVQNEFEPSLCGGGITWNPTLAPYKNAITNELFISSSIGMYLYYPGDNDTNPYPSPSYMNATNITLPVLPALAAHDPLLLTAAVEAYEWFSTHNFTNAQGLIVDGFHISKNQTTCDERNEMVYTYNQGVLLSGLWQLWEATGDTMYLSDGHAFVETVINATGWYAQSVAEAEQWAGLGRHGIMEDYCDATANCSQDNQIFKGIYFHHLALFCEPLPTSKPLIEGLTKIASVPLASQHASNCESYMPWIQHNAYAALSTRNGTAVIGGWWGAPHANKTQDLGYTRAVARPHGSVDELNEPWLLDQAPWVCAGWHCRDGGGGAHGNRRRMAGYPGQQQTAAEQDSNDGGRGRTVETQGSGLGVVKAASDFTLRKKK